MIVESAQNAEAQNAENTAQQLLSADTAPMAGPRALFTSILKARSEKEVVEKIRLLLKRRTLFASPLHYEYFRKYVAPKVKLSAKLQRRGTYVVREYVHENKLTIAVSDSYLVIRVWVETFRVRSGGMKEYWGSTTHSYVLGVDSNCKIFVNKIPEIRAPTAFLGRRPTLLFDRVSVYAVDDEDVEAGLGFRGSVDGLSKAVVVNEGEYRVQGEVVLDAFTCDDYVESIARSFRDEVRRLVQLLLADRVFKILMDLSFSPRLTTSNNNIVIEVPRCMTDGMRSDEALDKMGEAVRRALEDTGMKLLGVGRAVYEYESDLFGRFNLIYYTNLERGSRYWNACIEIDLPSSEGATPPIVEKIYDDLKAQLKALMAERRDFKFALGRHVIRVKRGLSCRVGYTPSEELQPLYLGNITLDNRWWRAFYVDEKSEVEVYHEEHGEIKMRFARPFIISFRTTFIDDEYNDECNRIALALLMEK
jgi:hypothetical protein